MTVKEFARCPRPAQLPHHRVTAKTINRAHHHSLRKLRVSKSLVVQLSAGYVHNELKSNHANTTSNEGAHLRRMPHVEP